MSEMRLCKTNAQKSGFLDTKKEASPSSCKSWVSDRLRFVSQLKSLSVITLLSYAY